MKMMMMIRQITQGFVTEITISYFLPNVCFNLNELGFLISQYCTILSSCHVTSAYVCAAVNCDTIIIIFRGNVIFLQYYLLTYGGATVHERPGPFRNITPGPSFYRHPSLVSNSELDQVVFHVIEPYFPWSDVFSRVGCSRVVWLLQY